MLTKKRLLTTVLCGALLFAASAGDAVAMAGRMLQPNSDWAISKLEATQAGGTPYCALARRFNNDLILTLARNTGDESSIAVDFQKQALDNAQSYVVSLKPGFGQDRSFNVRPVSGKALVIRLGKDYAFYDALNRSGKLEVDISGESYGFNLPDFAEGQKKLSACLVNLVEPAAGGADQVVSPVQGQEREPVVVSSSTAGTTAGAGGADVNALREENMRLRSALERERRTYEDRYMQEAQGSSMAAELKEKIRILEMENSQLKQQVAYVPAAQVSCPVSDGAANPALTQELTMLRDENLRLKQDVAAEQAKSRMLEMQVANNAGAGDAAQNAAAEVAVMARLRERVQRLEEENKALAAAASATASGASGGDVSLAQLRSLEEQLRFAQEDRAKLLQQVESLSQGGGSKGAGRLDISSDNWNLEQATRRFNEAEREIRRLGRELEEQQAHCSMEKKELEYMLFDPEVAKKEQISKLIELENQNAEMKDKLSMLELEKTEYEQKIVLLEQDIATGGSASGAPVDGERIALLERERNILADEKHQLSMKVASLESALANIQPTAGPASPPPPVMAEPVPGAPQYDDGPVDYSYGTYQEQIPAPQAPETNYRPYQERIYPAELPPAAPQQQVPQMQAAAAPVSQMPAYQASYQPYQEPVAPSQGFMTLVALKALLSQAQIQVQGPVELIESGSDFVAYSWDAGGLFGTAEQEHMKNISEFDGFVNGYLEKTRYRCQGDFASVPAVAEQNGQIRVSSYEIACIMPHGGASASVVFYNDGNLFTTIAHETDTDNMAEAMDARDKIVGMFVNRHVASN